jgi:surface polysaccharide O-acyltransferase-like enzyme
VHTKPFLAPTFDPGVLLFGALLSQSIRVAVPFFFMAAGYFFAVSLSRGAIAMPHAAKLIRRLALFLLFWSAVYIVVPIDVLFQAPGVGYWSAVRGMIHASRTIGFVLEGSKYHLWFLPALISALALLAVAVRLRLERSLIVFAVGLYLLGLIGGAYKSTPIGLDLGVNTRDGPFYGTIFVVSGFMIHRWNLKATLRQALGLVALGVALRAVELLWVSGKYNADLSEIDYLVGTYPFSIGIFMLLLNAKRLGEIKWLVWLSRYSAGFYCAHMLIVELLAGAPAMFGRPWWEIARPFIGFVLTFALVISLGRIRILRPVLT